MTKPVRHHLWKRVPATIQRLVSNQRRTEIVSISVTLSFPRYVSLTFQDQGIEVYRRETSWGPWVRLPR